MTQLDIGNKIRELRKKKGITQEALAATLSVSPQAVSKWESNLTYPDMAMIPAIARYFGVSLDVLFGYDAAEIKAKVKKIEEDACKECGSDYKRYVEILKDALHDYPDNEDLLYGLLDVYARFNRKIDGKDHLDEAITIADKILAESSDDKLIRWTKERLAGAYLDKGDYDKAKAIYETFPNVADIPTQCKAMAYNLYGEDKLYGAYYNRREHLIELYIACEKEGDAWYYMADHCKDAEVWGRTLEEFIPEAIKCYQRGAAVLELFLESEGRYLYDTQSFHWGFYQCLAACYKKLRQTDECEKAMSEAYRIVTTGNPDFEEKRDRYIEGFNRHLRKYGLEEYAK